MSLRFFIFLLFCLLPLVSFAQGSESLPAQERYLFELLRAGGWTMVPLALCLLAALYLLLYCWRETSPQRFFSNQWGATDDPNCDALRHFSQGDSATSDAARQKGALTLFERALARGLGKARGKPAVAGRAAAENAIGETLTHAEAEQLRWIGYLNIIAALAPMIGLLGTVSGMIGAFGTISTGGMGSPEMLAGNIGEALVSTATGLAVAIPAMLCYHVLHNRLGLRMNETVSRLNDALDEYFGKEP